MSMPVLNSNIKVSLLTGPHAARKEAVSLDRGCSIFIVKDSYAPASANAAATHRSSIIIRNIFIVASVIRQFAVFCFKFESSYIRTET